MTRVVLLALLLTSCAPSVRFLGVTARPEGYGGGYLVTGECSEDGVNVEPCWWLCSPEQGGGIACGRIPWLDWTP